MRRLVQWVRRAITLPSISRQAVRIRETEQRADETALRAAEVQRRQNLMERRLDALRKEVLARGRIDDY